MSDETVAEEVEVEAVETEVEAVEAEVVESEVGEVEEVSEPEPSESSTEKSKVQERFDELTRLRIQAERERDYFREQALKVQEAKPPEAPEPIRTLEDFEFDEVKYQAYLFEKARENSIEEAKRVLQEEQAKREQEIKLREFRDREREFSAEVKDYVDVAGDPTLPVNNEMAEIIKVMDNGPQVLYHLGKNREIADSISRLPPLIAARELGRLEERLSNHEKPKTVSDAPSPPPKIKPGNAAGTKNIDDMTDDEYDAYRRKIIAKRRS